MWGEPPGSAAGVRLSLLDNPTNRGSDVGMIFDILTRQVFSNESIQELAGPKFFEEMGCRMISAPSSALRRIFSPQITIFLFSRTSSPVCKLMVELPDYMKFGKTIADLHKQSIGPNRILTQREKREAA